ncbi:head-tail connector protein [Pseudooceanicola algae]|uniref:Uncharacterized protein n=1 Tax=Pseudooceanicola algae TaxID=1537215 RepID=A0A418SC14_9RHOB|nr:hypothetical protein [Pseudooceanicola algae]QPM89926.1 hypothetical protein PSAL_011560 [Pseudooceanicola algae]
MILIEENKTPTAVLPIDHFKEHLRMGSGFAEDTLQNQVLEGYLRAAISSIEGRTGQALYARNFVLSLSEWQSADRQVFPLAPVRSIFAVTVVNEAGVGYAYDSTDFKIVEDSYRPALRSVDGSLPTIPDNGRVEISINAGSAEVWSDVPPDLAQAVLLMAAHYYEYRNDLALGQGCTPFGVTALIERYRPMRLSMVGGQS